MNDSTNFQGEQDLQHQNTEADTRKVTQVQNVIIGAAPGVPLQNTQTAAQPQAEATSADNAPAAQQANPVAQPIKIKKESTVKLLGVREVGQVHDIIKDHKDDNISVYFVIVVVTLLLGVLLFVLTLAFNNIDANIAIYVCAAIAAIGIFLIYTIGHLAKHLFQLNNKYQLRKLELLIDYTKSINETKN